MASDRYELIGNTSVLTSRWGISDRATVDAFHVAAMEIGAKDNGAPGLRTQYHPNYYAAFVFDPCGHNIEVVCHLAS